MYRILIVCVLILQTKSRPFGHNFLGRASPFIQNPWLLPSITHQTQSYPAAAVIGTIRMHQNEFIPFSKFFSSPARIYGRISEPSPLSYQPAPVYGTPAPFYGAPPAGIAPFIPSFNPNNQPTNVHNEYGSPNYHLPSDAPASLPQLVPSFAPPTQTYGSPTQQTTIFSSNSPFISPASPSPNHQPSSNPSFGQIIIPNPFQSPPAFNAQLSFAQFPTNVLPLIPHINSPSMSYLPTAATNQKDSTSSLVPTTEITPSNFDSDTNANESKSQTELARLPATIDKNKKTTQDGSITTIVESSTATTNEQTTANSETLIETTISLLTTSESSAQSNDSTFETSSRIPSLGLTGSASTDHVEDDHTTDLSIRISDLSTTESYTTEMSEDVSTSRFSKTTQSDVDNIV